MRSEKPASRDERFWQEEQQLAIWRIWSSHCDSGLRTQRSLCEDAVLIPGLAQWVKDLALPAAQIQCSRGCGVGLNCSSDLTPSLGTSTFYECGHGKKTKGGKCEGWE